VTAVDKTASVDLDDLYAVRKGATNIAGGKLPDYLSGLAAEDWREGFDAVLVHIACMVERAVVTLVREMDSVHPDPDTLDTMKGLTYTLERISGLRAALEDAPLERTR
jgi:hypothetical protein